MTAVRILVLILLASSSVVADESPKTQTNESQEKTSAQKLSARRLKFMKSSVEGYEFLLAPEFKSPLTVTPDPLLRFTNPVSGLQDGGFFVWQSDSGRPMVGAQVFLTGDDLWIHEFQSLAPVSFKVTKESKSIWEPERAGVKVQGMPDAPIPAASAVQRLIQMRQMAKRFSVSDNFEGREQSDELRLLTNPLLRFGADDAETLDGALFVHAHGTDPELMIVLEAIKANDEYHWHYSLSPMTGYALKASLDGKPIWEVPWRQPPYDPKEPFFILVHSRELSLKNLFQLPR